MLIGFCPSSFQVLPICFNTPVMCPPWNARGKGEVTSERDCVRTHVFPVCLPSNFYFICFFFPLETYILQKYERIEKTISSAITRQCIDVICLCISPWKPSECPRTIYLKYS